MKAILELDLPKSCHECPLLKAGDGIKNNYPIGICLGKENLLVPIYNGKRSRNSECPLREHPFCLKASKADGKCLGYNFDYDDVDDVDGNMHIKEFFTPEQNCQYCRDYIYSKINDQWVE